MAIDKRRTHLDRRAADALGLREEPGWTGMFTRNQAHGAIKNDRRIVKTMTEPGDRNPVGVLGTVLGSVHHPDLGFAYWVEWDSDPKHAIFIVGTKIGEAS